MKKLLFFALAAAVAVGCSKADLGTDIPPQTDNDGEQTEQPEYVTVSFAMKGEVTVDERPLSRAAGVETESRDLYGISIYYDKEQDGEINDPYGYGLFDNVEDMVASLLTGYKYKFVCSLVKDGKDKINYGVARSSSSSYSNYKGYGYPFCKSMQSYRLNTYQYSYWGSSNNSYSATTALVEADNINKFVLGDGYHLTGLGQGYTQDESSYYNYIYWSISDASDMSSYPQTDRYYGETTDYTPKEGGVVTIDMKLCVFGFQFVVTGVSDGSFSFSVIDSENTYLYSESSIKSDTTFDEERHTFRDVYSCWQNAMSTDDYSQEFTINMTWVRGNNVTQTLDPLKITFKRNVMTTVNINLNGGKTDNSFDLKLEDGEMGTENKDFDIDAGDITDTPVDPKN